MKRTISTADAPEAVGAYSQATTDGALVFTAGQIPMTPDGDLLDDIEDFEAMNDAYANFFDEEPPARSAVEVANLPKGVGVEIESIATSE